jgi:hypothetical protein
MITVMWTVYVLTRNLAAPADIARAKPFDLQFREFRIWNIPQWEGPNGRRFTRAKQIFPDAGIQFDDCVLEKNYSQIPPSSGAAPSALGGIPNDIEDTLLLLRLFKVGDLSFVQFRAQGSDGEVMRQFPYPVFSDISTTLVFEIRQDDCPDWDTFASELKNKEAWTSPWFKVARRFFLYGAAKEFNCYSEPQAGIENNEVDRVVDYATALEATLVPERDFVGRRLRERAALLIGDGGDAIPVLKELYNVRSTTVHGSSLSKGQREFLTNERVRIEDTVRKIIVQALKTLPYEEEQRRRRLADIWEVSDKDRAQKVFEDFRKLRDEGEKRTLVERLRG